MRLIKRAVIDEFCKRYNDARGPLQTWYQLIKAGRWEGPAGVKAVFGNSVDFLADDRNRAIFDIKGNTYRLIAEINYRTQAVYIRFLDTHSEYDKVDAATVKKY
jgi:mRNA interferase HigB